MKDAANKKAAATARSNTAPKTAGGASRPWSKRKKAEIDYAEIQARLKALGATNPATWNACNNAGTIYCPGAPTFVIPKAPKLPPAREEPGQAPPPIPGDVVAYSALAELTLTAPKPVIGPPPSINPWKIAAVGYPLWLSVAGTTNPPPVTATALDVEVSLDARLTKVEFDMGDGHRVTCTQYGRPWHRGVEPGTPSPTCGYTYQRPSLPKGNYTVTARSYWAIDWRTSSDAGTLDIIQAATTTLPVGELQVLVR